MRMETRAKTRIAMRAKTKTGKIATRAEIKEAFVYGRQ